MKKTEIVFGMTRNEYMPILMQLSLQVISINGARMENVNRDLTEQVRNLMGITQSQMQVTGDSAGKSFFQKEIEFSWTFLKHMELISCPSRGVRELTAKGRYFLSQNEKIKWP